MEDIQKWIAEWLTDLGVTNNAMPYAKVLVMLLLLVIIAYLSLVVAKQIVKRLGVLFLRTSAKWDDILIEHKIFSNLAHIVPALIINVLAPIVFSDFDRLLPFIFKATDIYIVIVMVMIAVAFLKGLESHFSTLSAFEDKPLASYFQLLRIIIYIAVGILVLSILIGRSPIYFLSAFGAMTAVLLLIFKDTILGLVASIQISANDMVRVGDWVEMPAKYNADGDVMAMNLNTVKIRNWDKTISTVPTYYFITESFKNWRGMQESGGRRIKRSIHINLRSIKFVDQELQERLERFHLIKDFVAGRQNEIEQYNESRDINTQELINGRRMTNVGVFRQYITAFLKSKEGINQKMYMLVRQLEPDGNGLPIQIYCFSESVDWMGNQQVIADIFDHLLAAIGHFDLEVFQNPSGNDVALIGEHLNGSKTNRLLQD